MAPSKAHGLLSSGSSDATPGAEAATTLYLRNGTHPDQESSIPNQGLSWRDGSFTLLPNQEHSISIQEMGWRSGSFTLFPNQEHSILIQEMGWRDGGITPQRTADCDASVEAAQSAVLFGLMIIAAVEVARCPALLWGGKRRAVRWATQRTAMADAACCDGRCTALRHLPQEAAMWRGVWQAYHCRAVPSPF